MFTRQAHIPSPEQLRDELPLTKELTAIKKERDRLTMGVIAGRTEKLLLIIGPCSAHESAPVLEYVRRLGKLNERVKDKLVLVPRIYPKRRCSSPAPPPLPPSTSPASSRRTP